MSQADPSSPEAPSAALPRNVKVLGGASLLNDVASEAVFPLMQGFFLHVLKGNLFFLGLIEGLADTVSSLVKLWSGGRSDQAGRRKGFVLFGYAVAAGLRPLTGLLTAPWQLLVIRTGDRIGKGVRTAPRDALIADSTPPPIRGRAFGFHRAMDHLGAAIGPLLATAGLLLLYQFDPLPRSAGTRPLSTEDFLKTSAQDFFQAYAGYVRILFVLTVIPGLLVLVLLAFGLREAATSSPPREPLRLTLRPFGTNFRVYLVALAVFTLGNASDAFLIVRAGQLGVPVLLWPVLWAGFHVAKSSGNLVLGRAADRYGARPCIFLGWLVYAIIYLAFAFASEAWHAWALFLGYALFYGLTEPAEKALVANLAGPERKGLAFGWYNAAVGVMALPSSLLFGLIYQELGAVWAFGWGAALAAVAAVLLAGVRPAAQAVSQAASS
jgi:MFS family permease